MPFLKLGGFYFFMLQQRYRLEVEGVRAIAAMLVAIYHIWFNRVSGGVDVFFTVSGFLITTSLLSMYQREGTIRPISYIIKLLKRLIPSAWFIAIISFIISLLLAPVYTRPQNFSEFVASLFYFENWRLAWDAVDYLAQHNSASPFQHYWALAIQFQFYLIWLLLFCVAMWLKKWLIKVSYRTITGWLFGVVLVTSFSYSVYFTTINQPIAYYHTFTRVWEFSLGGLLAITIHKVVLPKKIAWLSGWVGLFALLLCGLVLQVSTVFPGYAALWPTSAAILILLAGNQSTRFSAYQILASKPLVSFGKISYAFYLWHWPILILFLQYFERGTVSLKAGIAIILLSTLLAYFTIYVIEQPIRQRHWSTKQTAIVLATAIMIMSSSLAVYHYYVLPKQKITAVYGDNLGAAAHKVKEQPYYYEVDTLIPKLELGTLDMSDVYADKCFQMDGNISIIDCEYGDTINYDYTIALVGGSHAAHWQPMLDEFGKDNNVRIKTFLKANCRFSTEDTTDYPECLAWFDDVTTELLHDPPDLVFTPGDISTKEWENRIPQGFIDAWEIYEEAHIPLFLVRDTPRFPHRVPICLYEAKGDLIEDCRTPRDEAIAKTTPLHDATLLPKGAHTFDATDYFCDDTYCYPIVGNIATHFDDNHISASISRSFMPIFEEDLHTALKASKAFTKLRQP